MDEDTTKSIFDKVFESFPFKEFCKIVAAGDVDEYVKKLKAFKLLYILVVVQMTQTESLKDLSDKIKQDKNL